MLKTILYRLAITLALVALLGSCGNDSKIATDGTLLANPTSFTFTYGGTPPAGGGCAGIVGGVGAFTQDLIIRVVSLDSSGNPTGKIDFDIDASFAENVSTGTALTAVLIDGVLVSGVGDPVPFTATTDKFGELYITLRYDTTYDSNCVYAGSVTLSSGVQTILVDFAIEVAS